MNEQTKQSYRYREQLFARGEACGEMRETGE